MTKYEPINGEMTLNEILLITIDHQIIIDGDDHEIMHQTDIIQILQIMMKDSDHVTTDITYQVDENGTQ